MTPNHSLSAADLPAARTQRAIDHATNMLRTLGLTDDSEDTFDTPRRLVKALQELTHGAALDPTRHLKTTFPPKAVDPGMIVVPGISFVSVCEHHLLPFSGVATVAYIPAPKARIVGLSKLARVVTEYAARPQVQERLGEQITIAITDNLDTLGAACLIRAEHSCMTLRGAKAVGASMVTSHLAGVFLDDPIVRTEFLTIAR